ncbi:hypothetical protein P7C70_g9578, partial [Phenoliferia sp. Uapishka_3]
LWFDVAGVGPWTSALSHLHANPQRRRAQEPWRAAFRSAWLKARATPLSGELHALNLETLTCSCYSFVKSRFSLCKHIVRVVEHICGQPPKLFWDELTRHADAPFIRHWYLVDGLAAIGSSFGAYRALARLEIAAGDSADEESGMDKSSGMSDSEDSGEELCAEEPARSTASVLATQLARHGLDPLPSSILPMSNKSLPILPIDISQPLLPTPDSDSPMDDLVEEETDDARLEEEAELLRGIKRLASFSEDQIDKGLHKSLRGALLKRVRGLVKDVERGEAVGSRKRIKNSGDAFVQYTKK